MNQKWDPKKVLQGWIERNSYSTGIKSPLIKRSPLRFYEEGEHIPISELEMAVIKAAKIVHRLGPDYIDIFARAERELENAKQEIKTMERIRKIANIEKPSYLESDLIKP